MGCRWSGQAIGTMRTLAGGFSCGHTVLVRPVPHKRHAMSSDRPTEDSNRQRAPLLYERPSLPSSHPGYHDADKGGWGHPFSGTRQNWLAPSRLLAIGVGSHTYRSPGKWMAPTATRAC